MGECECEYPKLLISDVKRCRRAEGEGWLLDIGEGGGARKTIRFEMVQMQGVIEQMPCDDIVILKDCSGKAKLTQCSRALGNKKDLSKGSYCGLTGVLTRESGLPEVAAMKLIELGVTDDRARNLHEREYWPKEVQDYQLFVSGALLPRFRFASPLDL